MTVIAHLVLILRVPIHLGIDLIHVVRTRHSRSPNIAFDSGAFRIGAAYGMAVI